MCGFLETVGNTVNHVTGIFNEQNHSSQESLDLVRARLLVGEQKAFRALQDSGHVIHLGTAARVKNAYNPRLVEKRDTKRTDSTNTRVRIAEHNQQALLRERRQTLKTEERIAEHRERRAQRALPCIPLYSIATKPSLKQPSAPFSPLLLSRLAHDISFYENQTDEESRCYVQERLTNILGPERMKFEFLPSGHSPIDPVIAEHHQKMVENHIIEQREVQALELRRQGEDQQRQTNEEEAERLRIQILLDHYRERYIHRLERLALYGPDLTRGADLIEAAILAGDATEVVSVMLALIHQVFLPIHDLLSECKQEIPLEEVGADKLKGVWPLDRLGALYLLVQEQACFSSEGLQMLQGIEVICKAVCNPTPFQDPLAPKQISVVNSYSKPSIDVAKPVMNAPPSEGLPILGTDSPPTSSSSFSKLLQTTAEAVNTEEQRQSVPVSTGFSKLLAATADKLHGNQEAAVDTTPDVLPPRSSPPESATRAAVLQYIATDNMYFESEVEDLVGKDTVIGVHRRNAAGCLKELLALADGEKGILGVMDAGHYRSQIEKCVTKIDQLKGSGRFNKETQALKKLCGSALMLWSIHCK